MKFIIETNDPEEARAALDAIETRNGATPTTTVTETATAAPVAETKADDGAEELDSIGMPYDPDLHTSTKTKNADGTWKAARGKADEAKAAAAEFKARGGNEEPPADLPAPTADVTTPAELPAPVAAAVPAGLPSAGGMPMATAAPAARQELPPVSQEVIEDKIGGMIGRGTLVNAAAENYPIGDAPAGTFQHLLDSHGIDRADPVGALQSSDALRASVYAACCEIEPEAP